MTNGPPRVAGVGSAERPLFRSFFIGGFECSTHVRRDGRRLDLIASTHHDVFVREDYERLASVGILTARDGVRWHLVDRGDGRYDWSSVLPMLRAARETGVQVIWDLLHFGWPEDLGVYSPEFVRRFEAFARAFGRLLADETDGTPMVAPVNEISFLSFAGGEAGFFNPFSKGRGDDLKRQLVRASIAGGAAVLAAAPGARLIHTDPIINIIADPERPEERLEAELYRQSMFAAWEMIAGKREPELGGDPRLLDVVGVNYYVHNQWTLNGGLLVPSKPQHLPVRFMLREVALRLKRPIFVAETGIEDYARAAWLHYMASECRAAESLGVPVEGLCIYPIVNHPGWEDDRHCLNGLWDYADASGHRPIDPPFGEELARQQKLLADARAGVPLPREDFPESVFDRVAADLDAKTRQSRES